MISQKNISLISNKTYRDGVYRIPEAIIEKDYCLAWFLFGLSNSKLRNCLIFKGGTALRRCYFSDYRFSEDLDFTLVQDIPLKKILKEFKVIFFWIKKKVGILFNHVRQEVSTYNTHTFYISYIGPLPGRAKEVKIDITYREFLIDSEEERNIIKTYEEYSDFPKNPTIKVYSLKEIAIEKTCTLFTPARNEPRDLFDIYYLISEAKVDLDNLNEYVDKKLRFKGNSLKKRKDEFLKKETRLKKLWNKRLSVQMSKKLPEYENVFRIVKRTYRQLGL